MVKMGQISKLLFLLFCFTGIFIEVMGEGHENTADRKLTKEKHNSSGGHGTSHPEDDTLGQEWCDFQAKLRSPDGNKDELNKIEQMNETTKRVAIRCEDSAMNFNVEHLVSFFSIFIIIGYGALVRSILKATGLNIPYTVILMISGLIIGAFSNRFCDKMYAYTAIARTPPQVILFLFLPVLIFESAFSIPVHTFMKSVSQILVAAFPGMVIATFATAGISVGFLPKYGFDFTEGVLFGSIISATDPVAVVAILRELGTSELLSVMIEGESLLNDGVAILLFEILEEIILEKVAEGKIVQTIFEKFMIIAIGGPIFGWVMAKIAIFCLSRIFNDATVEITITLVAAYLTYFIGDHMIGVSGVMAVVALGLTMSSERTSISPEVESSVHHFWEMLGYLANTVLFVLVGIIITETAINNLHEHDFYYLPFVYIAINIVRLGMLLVLAPILKRIGYGLKWENLMVMMWGGLRGAVGLCLAIEVYNGEICEKNQKIGAPFLFQTAGVVFLTLVVNGTTTKKLLETLKLTEISQGRLQDMTNATKQLTAAQIRTLNMLKHDRFLADANWEIVERFTGISDPYKQKAPQIQIQDVPSIISLRLDEIDHITECTTCHTMVKNEPTQDEFQVMTEEARLHVLKALKVSYWRQFEQGVLTELAVQVLVGVTETIEDKELYMIHAKDLRKYWTMRGLFYWLRKTFFKHGDHSVADIVPRRPAFKLRRPFWWLATREWFDGVILLLIVLNLIPIIWELTRLIKRGWKIEDVDEFFYANVAFTIIYTLEFLIKIIGRGPKDYIHNKWNYLDAVVLFISYIEITLYLIENDPILHQIFGALRVARLVRIIRLPRYIWPKIHAFVDRRLNEQLFLGYDVGKGFVTAVDDVLKFLPQMVDNKRIFIKIRHSLENVRLDTVREMGLLQKENPGIAIAVKTRHASRAILNQMRAALLELKEDGLVDDKENETLTSIIEENMKRLWTSPSSISPSPPEVLLANVSWILGNDELLVYVHNHATLMSFNFGDTICSVGDEPDGIYLIVSGMIKIHYQPEEEIIQDQLKYGKIPNMELFLDMTFRTKEDDFFSTGTVIGEQSVLTGERRSASVTSETSVLAYHIPQAAMKKAIDTFKEPHDTLESRLWRAVGIRIAAALLPTQSLYQSWQVDKIRLHLERSAVPLGSKIDRMKFPEFVSDAILVQGQLRNFHKGKEVFTAPCLIPHSCVRVAPHPNNSIVPPRLLIVAHEDIDHENITPSEESLLDTVVKASSMRKEIPTELMTARERRLSVSLNFGVRKKSERRLSNRQGVKNPFSRVRGSSPTVDDVGASEN